MIVYNDIKRQFVNDVKDNSIADKILEAIRMRGLNAGHENKVYLERRGGMDGQVSNISSEIVDFRIIPIVVFSNRSNLKITTLTTL